MTDVLRLAAFTSDPAGGNPAGVVLDASGMDDAAMLGIAAEVGYAETAFVTSARADGGGRRCGIRYFSPVAEVPFCGHATVATAVVLAERDGPGPLVFDTPVGEVAITTATGPGGMEASFTSVDPAVEPLDDPLLAHLLGMLALDAADLDPALPPRIAFAGNRHPVLVVADVEALDRVAFDPAAMRALMDAEGWAATVTVAHRRGPAEFEVRNVFPVGAIVEDPATGAAAAALGAYLREVGAVAPPADLVIHQGRHVGRPSLLRVHVPERGGITVSGTAVGIPAG
ncbi:oxidoreductase [Agromyces rhizosphaerae]|uniref:Oxidoreductase n=1 Tax=Agromyces rhizosphaerae TaxID=88374 RepID=A0A9W6CX25_9MICO|nr:PhzF family phenazine biosynthesis isomerase [Agromyces rhizosphaerae]GLI26812.1 oxidoreductase [Agromyces rhizosphaerae]